MCDKCLCKPVCGIYRATGGNVKACEHFHEGQSQRYDEVYSKICDVPCVMEDCEHNRESRCGYFSKMPACAKILCARHLLEEQ